MIHCAGAGATGCGDEGPRCEATPVSWGTGTANYGLGSDEATNVLWTYDDDTEELIKIE